MSGKCPVSYAWLFFLYKTCLSGRWQGLFLPSKCYQLRGRLKREIRVNYQTSSASYYLTRVNYGRSRP